MTVEGISGAGKSSLVRLLADGLRRRGIPVTLTRDPGGTPAGEAIRDLLLNTRNPLCPEAELALFFADRAQNLAEVIRPALRRGEWVIADRFTDSTIAYQGYGRGLPIERIRALDEAITGRARPHLALVLDLPVATAFSRLAGRDRIEREAFRFHERVRQGFLRIAGEEPDRVAVIPAEGAPGEVLRTAWNRIEERIR